MRNAGTTSPFGRGYSDAFNEWLTYNRFDIGPSHRAKLLVVMGLLPEIEAWRVTLPPAQRIRTQQSGRDVAQSNGGRPGWGLLWSASPRHQHRHHHRPSRWPRFDGALFSREWKDALWDRFFTAAPQRQRQSVEQYKIVREPEGAVQALWDRSEDRSLIPGLGVKLSNDILAGPTVLSAVGVSPPHDGVR